MDTTQHKIATGPNLLQLSMSLLRQATPQKLQDVLPLVAVAFVLESGQVLHVLVNGMLRQKYDNISIWLITGLIVQENSQPTDGWTECHLVFSVNSRKGWIRKCDYFELVRQNAVNEVKK